jgi:hypothetical protein
MQKAFGAENETSSRGERLAMLPCWGGSLTLKATPGEWKAEVLCGQSWEHGIEGHRSR